MTDITPLIGTDRKIIQGYGPGFIRVSGEVYQSPIAVFPDEVAPWDFTGDPAALKAEHFSSFLAMSKDAEVVLLGCGASTPFVAPAVRAVFSAKGMVLEAMDTGAACRTYNVLMTEGRLVAALLLPPS